MRLVIAGVLVVSAVASVSAQTPVSLSSLNGQRASSETDGGKRPQGIVAGNNPWLLAGEVSLRPLAGGNDFNEQWLFSSAKIVHEIPFSGRLLGGVHVPVMANLADVVANLGNGTKQDSLDAAVQALTTSADGLNVGVFPYWPLGKQASDLRPTLFAGIAAKMNSVPLGEEKEEENQDAQTLLSGRFLTGIELAVGQPTDGEKPLTLSLAGVLSTFSAEAYENIFHERRSKLMSVEFTAILPLRTGMGVLFEGVGVEKRKPSFRLGLLIAAGKAGDNQEEAVTPSTAATCTLTCMIQIIARGKFTAPVTVTVTQNSAPVVSAPSKCIFGPNTSDTCTFSAKPGSPVEVKSTGGKLVRDKQECPDHTCSFTPESQQTAIDINPD